MFISPTESVPNWPIRLGRIDAKEWSTASSLEPVLINPGIYSSAFFQFALEYIPGFIKRFDFVSRLKLGALVVALI